MGSRKKNKAITVEELSQHIAAKLGITRHKVKKILYHYSDSVKYFLCEGYDVPVPKIGAYSFRDTEEKMYQIPSGELVFIPKRKSPKFKFTVRFRQIIHKVSTKYEQSEMVDSDNKDNGKHESRAEL